MMLYGACLRFGYTPAEVRAMSLYDLRELTRFADWANKLQENPHRG